MSRKIMLLNGQVFETDSTGEDAQKDWVTASGMWAGSKKERTSIRIPRESIAWMEARNA